MLSGNPLLNDDRNLNTQAGLELNSAPVGLGNPLFSGGSPMSGLQNPPGLQNMEQFQQSINSILAPRQPAPTMPSQGQIFYSPSTGDIVVNGAEPFNERNASMALASEQWANQPARRFTLPDTASDWREMPREEYAAYLDGIRNPSFGRRMSEANEHAWRGMGDIALGASLAVNPEWEWAQTARENLRQEFINDAPFLMRLQDVENVEDGLTYAAQMAVQGVPWLVETLASMGVGALIGGAVSGGAGAPAGAVEGFLANQAIRAATRRSIETALRQNLARGARAFQGAQGAGVALTREAVSEYAVRTGAASADDVSRFFNFGERAFHMSRGGQHGAVAAMFGSNYMTGVGDIRNSIEDAGGDPQSAEAVANIWGLALPYALIESLGDIIITQPLTNIGPNILNATARSGALGHQLAARGTNIARGMGVVGTAEGIEEGAQYITTQQAVAGATNRPIDIEPMDLLENAAGGFFAGAGLGGITYGFKRPDVQLQDGGLTVDTPPTNEDDSTGMPWELGSEGNPGVPNLGPQGAPGNPETLTDVGLPWELGAQGNPGLPPAADPYAISGHTANQGPTAQEEREFLLRTLENPNLTPEQYAATVQALDALEGGRDTDTDAGDRYRAGANRGALPDYGPMPEYQEPEILDTSYSRTTDPLAIDTMEGTQEVPPGMSTLDRPARSRHPVELWQAINNGEQLEPREMQTLREAVQTLARQNPTNPGYTDVLNQLDRIEAEWNMDEYTEGTEAFKAKFPELSNYIETKPEGFKQSPMDAARPSTKATPRAGPRQSNVPVTNDVNNPIMPDGQRKYGPHRLKKSISEAEAKARQDGLRGRTEEPTAEPDLIDRAKKLGKKEKNRVKQREKRQKKAALKKSEREAERAAKMREMAERTQPEEKIRPFGRDSQARQDRYEAERRANEEATRESVLPEAEPETKPVNKLKKKAKSKQEAIEGDIIQPFDKADYAAVDEFFGEGHAKDILDNPDATTLYEDGREMFDAGETVQQQMTALKMIETAAAMGNEAAARRVGKSPPLSKVALTVEARERADKLLTEDERGGDMSLYTAEEKMLMEARMNEKYGDDRNTPHKYGTFDPVPDDIDAWVREVMGMSDKDIAARIDELVREQNQMAKRKADVIDFAAASKRIAAIRRKESNDLKEAASIKAEPVEATDARQETAYKQGLRNYKDLYKFLQGARGKLGRSKKFSYEGQRDLPLKATDASRWIEVNGTPLSYNELSTLIERVRAEFTANEKTERSARVFHDYVNDAWQQNKSDPKHFESFVQDNVEDVANWLKSETSKLLPPARNAAEKIIAKMGDRTVKAANTSMANVKEARRARFWGVLQKVTTVKNNNGAVTIAKDWVEQIMKLDPEYRNRGEVVKNFASLVESDGPSGVAARAYRPIRSILTYTAKKKLATDSEKPVMASDEGITRRAGLVTKREVKDMVSGVQKRIAPGAKFKSTHVFEDVEDMLHRANDEILIAPNGAEVNLGRLLMGMAMRKKLENQDTSLELTDLDWVRVVIDQDFNFRAGVLEKHDALIVFANKLGNRRHALQTLEHEWVVHKGLRAIFPTEEARYAFLQRVALIPGMDEKRKELLGRKGAEVYASLHILDQYEEVLAFHSEGGLLALEALLSGSETMNQETRMTLWQEFVSIVKEWLARVFGDNRTVTDQVLDEIVGMLQRYAITGTLPAGPTNAQTSAATGPSDTIIRAANLATPTPQETYEMLHGTPDNPGRPYQRRPWQEDIIDSVTSGKDIMVKLHEIGHGKVATPIKEGLKRVASELVTMVQMRMESPLIDRMMEIMDATIKRARLLITTWNDARPYARLEAMTDEWRARWGDKAPGSTKFQRESYGRMAIVATNSKLSKLSDSIVRASPRLLVRHPNGTYTINRSVFEELLKQGTFSKEDFLNGIEQFTVDSEGNVTSAGVAKLTKEQVEAGYDIYLSETRLMAESALTTLEAATVMMSQKNNGVVAKIIRDNKFKPEDEAFVSEALQRMYKLYTDIAFHDYANKTIRQKAAQADKARQVLAELMRTFHEKKKVADWTDSRMQRDETAKSPRKNDAFKWREQAEPHEDVKPFVDQIRWFLEYDDVIGDSRLARINGLGVNDNRQYQMLSVFQALLNAETVTHERENRVIQSILGNYVEMTRKGKWRVAFEVYEEDGKTRAEVSPVLLAKLPSFYVESEREANAFQAEFGQEFGDKPYPVEDVDGKVVNVKFDVSVARAPGQATMTDAPDIEGFLKVSELAGIKLGATEMKKITQLIANASTRKRFGLQRAGSPGMDADILRNNSETMTQRAWEAAKTSESHMLEEELADDKNRYGDWRLLEKLQRNFDIANRGAPEGQPVPITFVRNEAAVIHAELELLRYANQLRHVARRSLKSPTVNVRTTKGEQKLKITGEAEVYITHAKAMRESLEKNELELNLNDLLSKTGALRQLSVVSTLGTVAAGVMNAFTPITTLPSRLMAIHRQTGYGDGFELSEVIAEIAAAISQVITVFKGYGDTVMLKEILDKARNGDNDTGLTLDELEAMYTETLNGKLTPQQTYSLTGGTESNVRNLWYRTVSNILLKPFSSVEAATRRVAFLASYRLLKKRYIAAGVGTEAQLNDQTSDQYKKLIKAIESVIDDSQGDYNNINRPRAFRGDMAQYVFQYKMFPLMMVLLINNLPMAQKGVVLGTLFILAGLKGEPFADDFMDIYDTVMQKLGFQHDSLELSMVQFFEDLLPGSSKIIMHGFSDALFGNTGTVASRLGLGDIIPLTGLFRPEADVGREIVNAFGPAFGSNIDYFEYASILTDHALEFAGMRPRTSAWEDLIRKFPQGQLRSIGEATIMGATGEISDPRGRLTSDEVTIYNTFMRALGFYPLEASKANDTVRLDRMHTGYMRNIRTRFVLAYARAYRAGDEDGMERINDAVRDWNEAAELTGQDDMLIRNFRSAAVRAGRAASQTAIERTSSSAPDYSLIDELALITGADTETDE